MTTLGESTNISTTPRLCLKCSTPYVKDQTFENHNEQGDWMCKDCWVNECVASYFKLKEKINQIVMKEKINQIVKKLND